MRIQSHSFLHPAVRPNLHWALRPIPFDFFLTLGLAAFELMTAVVSHAAGTSPVEHSLTSATSSFLAQQQHPGSPRNSESRAPLLPPTNPRHQEAATTEARVPLRQAVRHTIQKTLIGLAHLAVSPLARTQYLIQERLSLNRIKKLETQMSHEEIKLLAYQTQRFLKADASYAEHFQGKPFYYANDRDRNDTVRLEHHPRFSQWAQVQDHLFTTRIKQAQWKAQAIFNPSRERKSAIDQALTQERRLAIEGYHTRHQAAVRSALDLQTPEDLELLAKHSAQYKDQLQAELPAHLQPPRLTAEPEPAHTNPEQQPELQLQPNQQQSPPQPQPPQSLQPSLVRLLRLRSQLPAWLGLSWLSQRDMHAVIQPPGLATTTSTSNDKAPGLGDRSRRSAAAQRSSEGRIPSTFHARAGLGRTLGVLGIMWFSRNHLYSHLSNAQNPFRQSLELRGNQPYPAASLSAQPLCAVPLTSNYRTHQNWYAPPSLSGKGPG